MGGSAAGKAFLSGISLTGVKYLTQSESFSKIIRPAQERDLENRKRLSRFPVFLRFSQIGSLVGHVPDVVGILRHSPSAANTPLRAMLCRLMRFQAVWSR